MTDPSLLVTAMTHVLAARLRAGWPDDHPHDPTRDAARDPGRDRGAISLEQVLWFVAAGVSVAVIAAILWNQIRDQANTPIDTPSAP
ncbi:MAG: hypothetical protein EA389_13765 [Ilumatobacter sp.]|nr:MAG: hypothetical protein EA389_13765 [Ilumatobacter sp.]